MILIIGINTAKTINNVLQSILQHCNQHCNPYCYQ